jgi:very-short-patch-repair endonuclease
MAIAEPNRIELLDHHRSHHDIIGFSNREFYGEKLRIATRMDKLKIPNDESGGVEWTDVKGQAERPGSGSLINNAEAEAIVKRLRLLVIEGEYDGTIGVVTPFRAQADRIQALIGRDSKLQGKLQTLNEFIIGTAHTFQGNERDVIMMSLVASDGATEGARRFLNNTKNLINVAITRARAKLYVFGNFSYCMSSDIDCYRHFAEYCEIKNFQIQSSLPIKSKMPTTVNLELISDWERKLYCALYEKGIVTIPQYHEEHYNIDLALIDGERKLAIEVDGEAYHRGWNGELAYRDQLRNQRLFELGWDVKRFWVYQIRDELDWCVYQIEEWLNKG